MTDLRTAEAEAYRKWYKLKVWLDRRAAQLSAHPLCEWCQARNKIVPAKVAHHEIDHKGDWFSFINGKLISLCKPCHDDDAQSDARGGFRKARGFDPSGSPTDQNHHWNT